MKIIKIASGSNNILRFNTDARLEVFVDRWDIEAHSRYEEIVVQTVTDDVKISQLKQIAAEIVLDKASDLGLNSESEYGIKITPGDLSVYVIDFERMPWDEMLHPEIEE